MSIRKPVAVRTACGSRVAVRWADTVWLQVRLVRKERPSVPTTYPDFDVVAEAIRAACIDAATQAYEDAGIRGLCDDGRWEYAIAAIRRLDLQMVKGLTDATARVTDPPPPPVKN
jgi:hypothetical protein